MRVSREEVYELRVMLARLGGVAFVSLNILSYAELGCKWLSRRIYHGHYARYDIWAGIFGHLDGAERNFAVFGVKDGCVR